MIAEANKKLAEYWKYIGRASGVLDSIEKKVGELVRPAPAKGRETPFWGSQNLRFDYFDYTPQEASLVHDAYRVTRVVRLSYLVTQDLAALGVGNSGESPLRPTPRGLVGAGTVFDFDWSLSLGSTERNYTTGLSLNTRTIGSSRTALGNPENQYQLLFNERHPIVLRTNEFLTFKVTPTVFFGIISPFFPVNVRITYAGYRTYGDDESQL